MQTHIFPAIRLTLVCVIVFIVIYPAVIWGIAQFAPNKGKGDMVSQNGKSYYSNIGQKFTADNYFNSRPSAADYNAASAGASNKGPTNPDYLKDVQSKIDTFLVHNPDVKKSEIPSDMVTASGSGLDPNISVQAAKIQIKRIAKIRNLPADKISNLVEQATEKPLLGLFGTEKINVLKLNLALDKM